MSKQLIRGTARSAGRIGGLAVTAAIVGVLMTGGPAVGKPAGGGSGDHFDNEAEFRSLCTQGGGTFKRASDTGTLVCLYKDGTIILCDAGARNCTTHKPARLTMPGSLKMHGTNVGQLATR